MLYIEGVVVETLVWTEWHRSLLQHWWPPAVLLTETWVGKLGFWSPLFSWHPWLQIFKKSASPDNI